MSETEPDRTLSIVTDDLSVSVDGVSLDVHATDRRVFVDVPTVRAALHVARRLPIDSTRSAAAATVARTGLTIEIRVRGRTVALAGSDARPGPLSRRLGIAPVELRIAGLVGAGYDGMRTRVRSARRLFA